MMTSKEQREAVATYQREVAANRVKEAWEGYLNLLAIDAPANQIMETYEELVSRIDFAQRINRKHGNKKHHS